MFNIGINGNGIKLVDIGKGEVSEEVQASIYRDGDVFVLQRKDNNVRILFKGKQLGDDVEPIKQGDTFSIGDYTFEFEERKYDSDVIKNQTLPIELKLKRKTKGGVMGVLEPVGNVQSEPPLADGKIYLDPVEKGETRIGKGETFRVKEKDKDGNWVYKKGKGAYGKSEFDIQLVDKDDPIVGEKARIVFIYGRYALYRMDKDADIEINGGNTGKGRWLPDKARIKIGKYEFIFYLVPYEKDKITKFPIKLSLKKGKGERGELRLGFRTLNHLRTREVINFEYKEDNIPEKDVIAVMAMVLDSKGKRVEDIGEKVKIRCEIENKKESSFLRLERGHVVEDKNPQEAWINDDGFCIFYYRVGKGKTAHNIKLEVAECDDSLKFDKSTY